MSYGFMKSNVVGFSLFTLSTIRLSKLSGVSTLFLGICIWHYSRISRLTQTSRMLEFLIAGFSFCICAVERERGSLVNTVLFRIYCSEISSHCFVNL